MFRVGYKAVVYNRTISKCDTLRQLGATVCSSPADVAQQAGTVLPSIITDMPSCCSSSPCLVKCPHIAADRDVHGVILITDVVFTIVGFPADVRQVILGPQGVLQVCAV